MTETIARCFRCRKMEKVEKLEITNDGVIMTLACGYKMRKIFGE